jgi:hypothetical protein
MRPKPNAAPNTAIAAANATPVLPNAAPMAACKNVANIIIITI